MRSLAIAAALCGAVGASPASANLNWDLQLQQQNIGVIGTQDVAYGVATLYNLASSTSILDLSAQSHQFELKGVYRDGVPSQDYQRNFGNEELFPWTAWLSFMSTITLAPGESRTFDYFWIAPSSAAGAQEGNYSIVADMCLGGAFGCAGFDTRSVTLTWTVATVPEPTFALTFGLGIGLLWITTRRRRDSSILTVTSTRAH